MIDSFFSGLTRGFKVIIAAIFAVHINTGKVLIRVDVLQVVVIITKYFKVGLPTIEISQREERSYI